MSLSDRICFGMMSFVHETLYGLFRNPYAALEAAGLESGQEVLEVGCGPGFFTIPAAEVVGQNGSVTSLDVSPAAVEHVRQKVERSGVSNVEVLLADAARTSLPEGSFDLVFVFGMGHVVGDIREIWAELYRLLKPAGVLSVEGRLRPPSKLFHPLRQNGRISQFRRSA